MSAIFASLYRKTKNLFEPKIWIDKGIQVLW